MGTGSVFSVEGQGVVLPAWYTSRSQKKPYVTWLLDKADADPFQVTGGTEWGGAYGAFNMGDACVAHNVGGVPTVGRCPQWRDVHGTHDGHGAHREGCPCWGVARDGEMLGVPMMGRFLWWEDAPGAHNGDVPMVPVVRRCLWW